MKKLFGLLKDADVFITSMRPQALSRLGLDFKRIQKKFPKLVHLAITGYSPPNENKAGHDLTYQANLGLLGEPPQMPRTVMADLAGAQQAVNSILSALLLRHKTKKGKSLTVSIEKAAELFAKPFSHGLTKPGGPLGGGLPYYQIYETKEGSIAFAALEKHFLEKFPNQDFKTLFKTRSAEEWEKWAIQEDVPIVAIKKGNK